MNRKSLTLILALFALLASAVSAHDDSKGHGHAFAASWGPGPALPLRHAALLEATGLEADALKAALREGTTVAELIAANDGDVDSVIAAIVADVSAAINENAADAIAGLEETISDNLNATQKRRFPWWRPRNFMPNIFRARDIHETVMEATGLDARAMNEALADGATVAELIEANDGDVAATTTAMVERATEGIETAAAARIERFEAVTREAVDADFSQIAGKGRRGRGGPRGFFLHWVSHSGTGKADVAAAVVAEAEVEAAADNDG